MMFHLVLIITIYAYTVAGQLNATESDYESRRVDIIVDLIEMNLKKNGWSTILMFGNFPNELYHKLQSPSYTFAITNLYHKDKFIEDVVPYYTNTILINLLDMSEYIKTLKKIISSPYWHPLANVVLYCHQKDRRILPKIFFIFWHKKVVNAIIVQYDDHNEDLLISYYTPYTSGNYKLDYLYGCWTTRRTGIPVSRLEEYFCEKGCHNLSVYPTLKSNNLGTCISFSTIHVPYNNSTILNNVHLFEDKSKDFYGFPFKAFVMENIPFFHINDRGNGCYVMEARDGKIWNTMSKLMNFSIDFTPSLPSMKEPFSYDINIKHLFDLAARRLDLFLGPIYLFDFVVLEVDYTFPYKDSGVCIISSKAGFQTTLFDSKTVYTNQSIILQFVFCFLCIWIIFSVYQMLEKRLSFDQIGKDLLNAVRNVLLITLYNPPKRETFRIFLGVSIWSFFILNFSIQATIISFLTAAKRGKNVNTFEDVIAKGYYIYGMASPDIILPDTEERFNIINSRLVPIQDPLECVKNLSYDSQRFCLTDCSVGRYLTKNMLNSKGEQYLHIAQDRIHSHHLTMLHYKYSPITERFDKYQMRFLETGLINKWEQYRYTDIKEDILVKALEMGDFYRLFYIYSMVAGLLIVIFLTELSINYINCHHRVKKLVGQL